MLTKKPAIDTDAAEKFISGAPLAGKTAKTEKTPQTFLHIPISRELRNQLKARSAAKGKRLHEYCVELLGKSAD